MKNQNDDEPVDQEESESLIDEFRRLAKEKLRRKIDRIVVTRDEFGRHTFWPDAETGENANGVQIVLPSASVDVLEKLVHGIRNAETIRTQLDRMRHVAMWLIQEAERIEAMDSSLLLMSDVIH